tara:strand:+ start:325 stop:1128 length:804 start_codon:yes stop_codon:yes gene_type:complete
MQNIMQTETDNTLAPIVRKKINATVKQAYFHGNTKFTVETNLVQQFNISRRVAKAMINNVVQLSGIPENIALNSKTITAFDTSKINGRDGAYNYKTLITLVRVYHFNAETIQKMVTDMGVKLSYASLTYHINKIKGKFLNISGGVGTGSGSLLEGHIQADLTEENGVFARRRTSVPGFHLTHGENIRMAALARYLQTDEATILNTFTRDEISKLDLDHLTGLVRSGQRKLNFIKSRLGVKHVVSNWGINLTTLVRKVFNTKPSTMSA